MGGNMEDGRAPVEPATGHGEGLSDMLFGVVRPEQVRQLHHTGYSIKRLTQLNYGKQVGRVL